MRPRLWLGACVLWTVAGPASPQPAAADSADSFQALASRFTAGWSEFRRPGVVVHASDPAMVSDVALDALSSFVDSCAVRLDLSAGLRRRLRRRPIHYYLCADPHELHFLSGMVTEGVAFPAANSIVTKWLPHEHEVVHILANLRFRDPELKYEPVLREGLATWLGGRSDESPAVVLAVADRALDASHLNPDALWGATRFEAVEDQVQVAYAVSARLVQYLVARGGMRHFLELYRLLAADEESIRERPQAWVLTQVEGMYEARWSQLYADFQAWRQANPVVALQPAADDPAVPPNLTATSRQRTVRVWNQDDGTTVLVLRGGDRYPEGLVQWGPTLPERFHSRLRRQDSAPRRFGCWVSPHRAEVFDYLLDKKVAVLTRREVNTLLRSDAPLRRVGIVVSAETMRTLGRPVDIVLTTPPTAGE